MSTASEKANLARIRDNQRRSRARRKEYLQELEARLRQCELHGIEASSEIQLAARRVADENKKLRGLLAQHGVGDDHIDAYLHSSPTSDTLMGNHFGSSSNAVQVLDQLLQTRKAYYSDGNTGAPTNSGMGALGSRDSSTNTSTVQSIWDNANQRRSIGLQTAGKAASSAHQFMTPSRSASTASSIGHRSSHSMSQNQRLNPLRLSRGHSPHPDNGGHNIFDFDHHLSPQEQQQSYNSHHSQQHRSEVPQSNSKYMPITASSSSNVNSCVFATDMITTMAGGDPNAVRADLGCIPGMDCEVDNQLVFNVMDRYTGVGL